VLLHDVPPHKDALSLAALIRCGNQLIEPRFFRPPSASAPHDSKPDTFNAPLGFHTTFADDVGSRDVGRHRSRLGVFADSVSVTALIGSPVGRYCSWMGRRKAWRAVLEAEVRRWSALSSQDLLAKLGSSQVYEVEFDGKPYQVEVEILADEPEHVQVMVSVDDSSLPASLVPAIDTFVRAKRPK
jgi:hypothetical protein